VSLFKKARKKVIHITARVRHTARKTPLAHYAPAFGTERTLAGTKLSPKGRKALQKEKAKGRRKTKRQIRKIWRKLI
jgi:uncharacterized membrane protein